MIWNRAAPMPPSPSSLAAIFPTEGRRHYVVEPAGQWWRVVSAEGEVARYRTRAAALLGANGLAEAMRRLGLQSEVMAEA